KKNGSDIARVARVPDPLARARVPHAAAATTWCSSTFPASRALGFLALQPPQPQHARALFQQVDERAATKEPDGDGENIDDRRMGEDINALIE
uniref:Uncharacterized protein n=2 Tax=Aegilops tauschii subsp. strangulata TaxID=200361 RepID=A0A453HU49_AEGTS